MNYVEDANRTFFLFINFCGQNFVREVDGSRILEEFDAALDGFRVGNSCMRKKKKRDT